MKKFDYKNRKDITLLVEQEQPFDKGTSKKCIVMIDGKKYLFKYNYSAIDGEAKQQYFEENFSEDIVELNGDVSEVFSYFFLKRVNCDYCLPYDFAKYKGRDGCISPYFVDENSKQITLLNILMLKDKGEKLGKLLPLDYEIKQDDVLSFLNEFIKNSHSQQYTHSTTSILEHVGEFCKTYNLNCDFKLLERQINKMVIYDFFMFNFDRNWNNIVFIVDGKGNLKLSPLFDHGECFLMENFDRSEQDYDWDGGSLEVGITENGRLNAFENNKYFNGQNIIATDIAELAKTDCDYKQTLENCLNIDLPQTLADFEKQYKLILPPNYKNIITACYNMRRDKYIEANKKLEKRINKALIKN